MNPTEKLMAYCMGALSSDDRLEVEEQLLSSKAFLTEFISVKRAMESGDAFEVEPSLALKGRLKNDILQTFKKREERSSSWLHFITLKPAMGVAFAILVILGSAVFFLGTKNTLPRSDLKNGISVDAVNPSPINFNVL